ncbi:prepilin-type N-terminal cleavage/methylation domain-containing protein, partial [Petrachloros mirabilis]
MRAPHQETKTIVATARFRRAVAPNGFTLLEVVIAIAILALALPILLGLRNWDLDLHARAADITTATFLAQEKLAEAELSPSFPLGETSGDFLNPPLGYQALGDVANR